MVYYISLGYDCSTASALRNLNLRSFALPFDWVESQIQGIEKCLKDDFKYFHKDLMFNKPKNRLVDSYLFQFPHDYPFNTSSENFEDTVNSNDNRFREIKNDTIVSNWNDYHDEVLKKYDRRIQRFRGIANSDEPIIVLCRYNNVKSVTRLQNIFSEIYNKNNVYFINSDKTSYENDRIININTEKNDIWNESNVWKEGIEHMKRKFNL